MYKFVHPRFSSWHAFCPCLKSAFRTQVRNNHFPVHKTMVKPLEKVLIANRGEIACRIMNTAKTMGIKTVAVYSDVDSRSLHVQMADEAYLIGPASATHSYLNQEVLINTAIRANVDAIHPGYGFLSENAEFAEKVLSNGLIFVGPPIQAIKDMGIKSTAKEIMSKAGVPVVPGYHGSEGFESNQDDNFLLEEAIKIGFPVMIKAIKGGGGKGMRISSDKKDFIEQLNSSRRESLKAFGDDEVLIEKFLINPRHIEVQVFADSQGACVHLFERDCSIQRRHQKVIEESPGPGIDQETRMALGSTGVKAALAVGYVGAGTVEFIYDPKEGKYYFMEMNTRLQVEHPVTEMVSMIRKENGQGFKNVDLVEWQFRIASGEPLPVQQEEISLNGHSVEARIYAEDTCNNFIPGSGTLELFKHPGLLTRHSIMLNERWPDVRIETGVRTGDEVSVHYDPMIAKVVVWDKDRNLALRKLNQVLSKTQIIGLETNVDFVMKLINHDHFKRGVVHTNFIPDHEDDLLTQTLPTDNQVIFTAFGSLLEMTEANACDASYRLPGVIPPIETLSLSSIDDKGNYKIDFSPSIRLSAPGYEVSLNGKKYGTINGNYDRNTSQLSITFDGARSKFDFVSAGSNLFLFTDQGSVRLKFIEPSFLSPSQGPIDEAGSKIVKSVMPGIIEKVLVKEGDVVKVGDALVILIAMKMEYTLKAGSDGIVTEVLFKEGMNVSKGAVIVKLG